VTHPHPQIPFDLPYDTALDRDDFFVSDANIQAVRWLDAWPEWPAHALVIAGPKGSGKSHLAGIWAQRAGALQLTAGAIDEQILQQPAQPVVVDRVDLVAGDRSAETWLFHLYNQTKEAGCALLMLTSQPPQQMEFGVADLASRLRSVPCATIAAPDDALLGALTVKLCRDRQLVLEPDVLAYLMPRIERSFDAVLTMVDRLDRLALAEKKPVTIPLVRRALASE